MSIFLSCILIKLSLFTLLRLQVTLLSEISLNICIFVSLLCTFDIVLRFTNLQDLKAIIAYGSVLHTNLLVTLIHLDSFSIIKNSIFYI
jgi:NADH:ubiquinone oxidoreductase subunit 4 (subunit M)